MTEYLHTSFQIIVVLCAITGIFSYKYANAFFKAISLQLFVYATLFMAMVGDKFYCSYYNLPYSNISQYYITIAIEGVLLFRAAALIMKKKLEKRIHGTLFFLFILTFLNHVFFIGLNTINHLSDITACISLTVVYTIAFNRFVQVNKKSWKKTPEILVIIGLVTYMACSVPYLAFAVYLIEHHPKLDYILYYIINDFLAILRYVLLMVALFLIYKNKGQNQLILN